jgi:cell wall-associated NlpC family hydrolase
MAIKDAVNLITAACTQWNLGYDQSNRLDFRKGGETDCSALVILTCEQAGLLPRNNIRKSIGATYTGNMRANFRDRGWRVLGDLPVSQLQPGDVLLNDGDHTAMYVGNGQVAQASIDEHGLARGGASGDQTDRETLVLSYYDFPWSCVLRFHGTAQPATPGPPAAAKPATPGMLIMDGVIGDASAKKLQTILGLPQTGVIDKGTFTVLQTHVGAPFRDGIASNQNSAAVAAHWPALKSFTVGTGGSPSVKSLQARVGVTQDGELGDITARAFQTRLNTGRL